MSDATADVHTMTDVTVCVSNTYRKFPHYCKNVSTSTDHGVKMSWTRSRKFDVIRQEFSSVGRVGEFLNSMLEQTAGEHGGGHV